MTVGSDEGGPEDKATMVKIMGRGEGGSSGPVDDGDEVDLNKLRENY
jgi:hypothetical protein